VNNVGAMRGVKWIEAGFVQTAEFKSLSGSYATLPGGPALSDDNVNSLQEKNPQQPTVYIDGDNQTPSVYPWYDSANTKGSSYISDISTPRIIANQENLSEDPNHLTVVTLKTNDSPALNGSNGLVINDIRSQNGSLFLQSVSIRVNFVLSVVVATSKGNDPNSRNGPGTKNNNLPANNVYTKRASVSWYFDGSAGISSANLGWNKVGYNATGGTGTTVGGIDQPGTGTTFQPDANQLVIPSDQDWALTAYGKSTWSFPNGLQKKN
jgi:hypothetical protein